MGAGDCPEEAKVQLLREVLDLNLGFSKAQLCRAIDHLVKEIGSSEEALAWIPRDNFTILVNYILDNDTDLECQQLSSPVHCEETRKMENQPMPSAHKGHTRTEERRKGGKPSTKGAAERCLNGRQTSGTVPFGVDQSDNKIEQRNNSSPSQKCLVDRNELRQHYKKKLCTDIVKVSNTSTNLQVNKARVLATETEHTNSVNASGHFIPNKKSRSSVEQAEQLVPKVAPSQGVNCRERGEDQKRRKKRESELDISMKKSQSFQKNGKNPEPEGTKEILSKVRALIPSGCQDLATGPRSPQVEKIKKFSQNQSSVAGHDDQSQVETMAQQNGQRKTPRNLVDLDEARKIPSIRNGFVSVDRGDKMREAETCRAKVLLSNNDRQKAPCSVLEEGSLRGEQDHNSHDADSHWLLRLEAFLKEGNCPKAFEVLKAWKEKGQQVQTGHFEGDHVEGRGHEMVADIPGKKRGFVVSRDISRGLERFRISCVNEYNTQILPENFLYVTRSVIRQAAHVDISFGRIGDLHCCCSDDCLSSSEACKCTDSTRGEYAYDRNGRLIERLATCFQSGCTTQNGDFITECCDKCRCSMNCGNRIVQRGITRQLQVFMTPTNKGWGVRALETIPARSFVCEYLGEIATNLEQFDRNLEYAQNGVFTYTMCLDADLDMEKNHFKEGLNDNEALVLDATIFGNVSRFVNHRCNDANLFMRPVQIETRDTHYYHAAFFAVRDIQEMEELTWDYGIDFQDDTHLLEAFECRCKSSSCRDKRSLLNRKKLKKGKNVKSSNSKAQGRLVCSQSERR